MRGYLHKFGGKKTEKRKENARHGGRVARVRSRSPFVRLFVRPSASRTQPSMARSLESTRMRSNGVGSSQQPLAHFPFEDWQTSSNARVTPSTSARRHKSHRSPRPIFASAARRCGRLVLSIDESYVEGLAAGARRS